MNPLIQCKTTILPLFIAGVLACFGLVPKAQAVVPPPDGGYPNFTTAEGQNALQSLTSGAGNTALGAYTLFSTTTASFNTAVGAGALDLNTGDSNTAVGVAALLLNTGTENTAVGVDALGLNTTGGFNAAVGAFALYNNTTGLSNTAIGFDALFSNTEGGGNSANGDEALYSNTTGGFNTANGFIALYSNTTGTFNTATGAAALSDNTTGDFNTANGSQALPSNTTGTSNTAIGFDALFSNTEGDGNTAVGTLSDFPSTSAALGSNIDGAYNTAVGLGALNNNTTGDSNTALGNSAGGAVITASNVICVGANVAGADVSNTTWMGNVYGVTTQSGTTAPVVVSDTGQLGTIASSERFKKDIAGMENASDAILSLRPVTFHYKTDTKGTPQFGLIAEEVAKVNPALVLLDNEGKPYTVRYDQVNAMLLNEFLKEHKKVEEQQATIAELKSTVAQQQEGFESKLTKQEKQIEALIAGLQKVSAQVELNKPAPQTVLNRQ